MLAIRGCVPPHVIPENQLWGPPLRLSTGACLFRWHSRGSAERRRALREGTNKSIQLLHELDPSSHLVTMREQCATVAYPTAHRSMELGHRVSL